MPQIQVVKLSLQDHGSGPTTACRHVIPLLQADDNMEVIDPVTLKAVGQTVLAVVWKET